MDSKIALEYKHLLAYELTMLYPQDDPRAVSRMVGEAKIDPNPHQIEATLFAYKALQTGGGAILADEVGLGKTIEAGLIINQYWAEGKQHILIVPPVSLRSQWQAELSNLFYLESTLMTSSKWKKLKQTNLNPIILNRPGIYIASDHLIVQQSTDFLQAHFDLVVIDEAHRLRNVYQKSQNKSKMAKSIKSTFAKTPKLLLTATPFQNHLNELYGLVSFIDESFFGSFESFQRLYANVSGIKSLHLHPKNIRSRIEPIFKRALRKDVADYLTYTKRTPVTINHHYSPKSEEEQLHKDIIGLLKSEYLLLNHRSMRGFIDLIYLKLLGSSPYAINPALMKLLARFMQGLVKRKITDKEFNKWIKVIQMEYQKYPEWIRHWEKLAKETCGKTDITYNDIEDYIKNKADELSDDFNDENSLDLLEEQSFEESILKKQDSPIESIKKLSYDTNALNQSHIIEDQIACIVRNYFRTHLPLETGRINDFIKTLKKYVVEAKQKGFEQKAVIFTEYFRTLQYVKHHIKDSDFQDWSILVYHGGLSNVKDQSGQSERDKVLEEFRTNPKAILIATEAGAEGLNLQFCNLVINYDLPWNPQRIEQRIGRCHRYGQKNDVIVVNFVCVDNPAESHIFSLLTDKFHLFEGIFGASNAILGAIQSGANLEKIFSEIYLGIRSAQQASKDLDEFLETSKEKRKEGVQKVAKELLQKFDPQVAKRLKVNWQNLQDQVNFNLSQQEQKLALFLQNHVDNFKGPDEKGICVIRDSRYPILSNRPHTIQRLRVSEGLPFISVKHPEVKGMLDTVLHEPPQACHSFDIHLKSSILEALKISLGQSGIFSAYLWNIKGTVNYAHLELILHINDQFIKHPQLRNIVDLLLLECLKGDSTIKDPRNLVECLKEIEENLKKGKEERSQLVFSERMAQRSLAIEDQKQAERNLMDEKDSVEREFNLKILKAPMNEKQQLMKERDKSMKQLNEELSIYRKTMQTLEQSKSKLEQDLLMEHDKYVYILCKLIFKCKVNFTG